MKRAKIILFTLLLSPFLLSCLWDRDTLADEMEGRLDVTKVIVGWFDRNPPLYYEMRLQRVCQELQKTPEKLELYDDGAVALDRLHRSDEAIALIEKKNNLLKAPETLHLKNHRYRYLANLGTFHAHRWISQPRNKRNADLTDLETAEKLIKQAIELNPDAHFGREEYQLYTIKWLLDDSPNPKPLFAIGAMRAQVENLDTVDELPGKSVKGLAGMVKLGAAWQSPDIYQFLSQALQVEGRSNLSFSSYLRVRELINNGGSTIHPHPDAIKLGSWRGMIMETESLEDWYQTVRKASDKRHQERTTYMLTLLKKGQHPDNHPKFWKDWKEPTFPKYKTPLSARVTLYNMVGLAILLLVLLWLISYLRRRKNLRQSAKSVDKKLTNSPSQKN